MKNYRCVFGILMTVMVFFNSCDNPDNGTKNETPQELEIETVPLELFYLDENFTPSNTDTGTSAYLLNAGSKSEMLITSRESDDGVSVSFYLAEERISANINFNKGKFFPDWFIIDNNSDIIKGWFSAYNDETQTFDLTLNYDGTENIIPNIVLNKSILDMIPTNMGLTTSQFTRNRVTFISTLVLRTLDEQSSIFEIEPSASLSRSAFTTDYKLRTAFNLLANPTKSGLITNLVVLGTNFAVEKSGHNPGIVAVDLALNNALFIKDLLKCVMLWGAVGITAADPLTMAATPAMVRVAVWETTKLIVGHWDTIMAMKDGLAFWIDEMKKILLEINTPAAPLVQAVAQSDSSILISWNPVDGATAYSIKARKIFESTFYSLQDNMTGTSYTHTGLFPSTTYYYQVTASNSYGESQPSTASATTKEKQDPVALPPATPNAQAAAQSDSSILISWSAVEGATYFSIKVRNDSESAFTLLQDNITGTSYTHTGLSPATTYYYQVTARNGFGESQPSSASATTMEKQGASPTTPNAQAAAQSDSSILISWSAVEGATYFSIKVRNDSESAFTLLQNNITGTSYTHTGLSPATTYYYQVTASNSFGESQPSSASATTNEKQEPPPAPTTGIIRLTTTYNISSLIIAYYDNGQEHWYYFPPKQTTSSGYVWSQTLGPGEYKAKVSTEGSYGYNFSNIVPVTVVAGKVTQLKYIGALAFDCIVDDVDVEIVTSPGTIQPIP